MSFLATLTLSGESLEKSAGLAWMASSSASGFYSQFDRIEVFYSDNLRKGVAEQYVHGSLAFLMHTLVNTPGMPYRHMGDVWDDRNSVVGKLMSAGRIGPRVAQGLLTQQKRFNALVPCVPWYEILPGLREKIIMAVKARLPRVVFTYVDVRGSMASLASGWPSCCHNAKVYILQADGGVATRGFSDPRSEERRAAVRLVERGVAASGNILVFVHGILRASSSGAIFGYRPMTKSFRHSYNAALDAVRATGAATLIEPQNGFGALMDRFAAARVQLRTQLAIACLVRELVL